MKIVALGVLVASGLMAGGCAGEARMTPQETADFRGAPAKPMTDAKKKAIADFQEQFRKQHPGSAAPPKGASTNLPPSGPASH
ncbi:MAG TPA: hypothetical protein VGL56_09645 [Fimbriimonadaceae bacterium]|jgi:hypothetical protein